MKPEKITGDRIRIAGLTLTAHLGVPEEERASPQELVLHLTFWPARSFGDLADDIANTVDYAEVAGEVRRFVAGRRDKLLETLAEATARHLLERFPLERVELELRKFVLPGSAHVAVFLERSAG